METDLYDSQNFYSDPRRQLNTFAIWFPIVFTLGFVVIFLPLIFLSIYLRYKRQQEIAQGFNAHAAMVTQANAQPQPPPQPMVFNEPMYQQPSSYPMQPPMMQPMPMQSMQPMQMQPMEMQQVPIQQPIPMGQPAANQTAQPLEV